MDIITLDFETYYDKDYSLSKITTEEYVRDPRFQVIGVGVKVNQGAAEWFSGTHGYIREKLASYDWANSAVLAHNMMFDGAIMSWRFGIRPKVLFDTLCMARAIHGVEKSASLKALAENYAVGEKGTEVLDAKGKRRSDFTPEDLAAYGRYCVNDVDLTYEIFNLMMARGFPKSELKLIDLTLRMFTEPTLTLDRDRLEEHLKKTQIMKDDLLKSAGIEDKAELMSNPKFAALLGTFGVPCPMKISPTTGKMTHALAKNDQGMKDLLEYDDPHVQALASARLGVKSTLEETRTQRFIDIAGRGLLPVPVRYYAAHTGRWGGDDKINLQNLPSRGPNAKALKKCIVAPAGYSIVEADSSQIEARMLAWLAGQDDVVQTFASKGDVYKKMASAIYNVDEADVTKDQRFVGKTTVLGCFAADTKVLTPRGWVPIVDVTVTDTVWDGEEWVIHKGVVPQGVKETIRFSGVAATPDHEILTERGWRGWSEVTTNPSLFQSALSLASSKSKTGNKNPVLGGTLLSNALAGGRAWLTALTSKLDARHGAMFVQNKPATESAGSSTVVCSPMMLTESACLTAFRHAYPGAIPQPAQPIRIMGDAVSKYMHRGAQIARHFFAIYSRLMGGTTLHGTLIGSTTRKDMNRGTSVSPRSLRTLETSAVSQGYRQKLMTYDIAFAGPRNRYTIATDAGALIVHNCGYGMGGEKFQLQLKNSGVDITKDEAAKIIGIYRDTNDMISGMWKQAGIMLRYMVRGDSMPFGKDGVLGVDTYEPGIILPNGLLIRYDGLEETENDKGGVEYSYKTRMGRTRIYGGKVVENVTQALARLIIGEQMLRISKKYRVVLTVHDSIVCCVPDDEAETCKAYVEESMRWVPAWAEGLPVDCEAGIGKNYGETE
jgi:hypothetical protein